MTPQARETLARAAARLYPLLPPQTVAAHKGRPVRIDGQSP
jgi:hypothetical protein